MFLFFPGKCLAPLNIVPVDFVAQSISTISQKRKSIGKTFHLCDPDPLTARKFIIKTAKLLEKKPPFMTFPEGFCRLFMPSAVDLLNKKIFFDNEIKLPFPDVNIFLPKIVRYYQQHQNEIKN